MLRSPTTVFLSSAFVDHSEVLALLPDPVVAIAFLDLANIIEQCQVWARRYVVDHDFQTE